MTRRLTTVCLMTLFLLGVNSPSVSAQGDDPRTLSLKGISAVFVLVEDLPEGARLGLTDETIQTDVELKLRLAGIRVVTREESFKQPGSPLFYVRVNLSDQARAASIEVSQPRRIGTRTVSI